MSHTTKRTIQKFFEVSRILENRQKVNYTKEIHVKSRFFTVACASTSCEQVVSLVLLLMCATAVCLTYERLYSRLKDEARSVNFEIAFFGR